MRISCTKLDFLLGDGAATLSRVVIYSMAIALPPPCSVFMVVSQTHAKYVPHQRPVLPLVEDEEATHQGQCLFRLFCLKNLMPQEAALGLTGI